MLPKKHRLGAAEVRTVLKHGKVLRTPSLALKYSESSSSKVAAVVSKKVAKGAAGRNAIRRALYHQLPSPLPRAHMVFLVQKNILDFSSDLKIVCSKLSL